MGQNDIGGERDQFRRVSANGGCIGGSPAGVDPHVAANAPAQTLQLLQKRSNEGLKSCIIRACGEYHANAPYALGLLRAHGKRPPDHRTAKKCDKLAPLHVPP
jgi:hypothetical protein